MPRNNVMDMSRQGRRILMVLESNYPTEGGGGAEGQLRTICRYLRKCCIPVRVIIPMRADGIPVEYDTVDDVPVWRIRYPRLRKIGGVVLLAKLARALVAQRHEYDVIHAHMANNMAAVCCGLGRLLGKTVVVKITGSLELDKGVLDTSQRNPAFMLKRMLFRQATYFQATSIEIRDRLVENGISPERIRVIPNAVDVARFSMVEDGGRPARDSAPTAIYVGRLSPEKAPDLLIAAWIESVPADSAAKLLLVGDGAMRDQLAVQIKTAGRDHQVRLLGAQEDVTQFLKIADFAIIPSLYEGLSNALLEFMAAGLPVLGTRVSGNVDFIDAQCGWLVDAGDQQALARQLKNVMRIDRALLRQMGAAARRRVTSRARIDAVIAQLAELYEIDAGLLKQAPANKPVRG